MTRWGRITYRSLWPPQMEKDMFHHAMNGPGLRPISVPSLAALLVLSVALLLAGCGGSATTPITVTPASQTTATTGTSGGGAPR